MIERDVVLERLNWCNENHWLQDCELQRLCSILDPAFAFAESLQLADSIHAHIKVRDADALDEDKFFAQGATIHYRKEGFVKYLFPGGINLIFSSIPISQDELRDASHAPEKMFLDHIGIDLRNVNADSTKLFDALPNEANRRGWGHVSQGDTNRPVYCCHIEVGRKHWIYPEDTYTKSNARAMPLEFALGELKLNDASSGCDLRPSDPRYFAAPTCGGAHT